MIGAPPNEALPTHRQNSAFDRAVPISLLLAVALIATALWKWGAVEVCGDFGSVLGLTIAGIVCVMLSMLLFSWFGISVADDVNERQNPAASIALSGAIIAIAIIYAAGNLGEGPSYAENFFSAGLGIFGFFVLWFALELGGRISMSVAEERDVASGIRFAAFALSAGLILARAVAGNWHSVEETVHDFLHDGWPATVLCLVAIIAERILRPTARSFQGNVPTAAFVAIIYFATAITWLWHLGRWEGMPK